MQELALVLMWFNYNQGNVDFFCEDNCFSIEKFFL